MLIDGGCGQDQVTLHRFSCPMLTDQLQEKTPLTEKLSTGKDTQGGIDG